MRPKHFLNFENFSKQDLVHIIDRAIEIKSKSETSNIFDKKTLGLIFQKPSTRTRVSFETAMNKLGGNTIFLSSSELQMSRGEPIPDTSKVLSSMVDAIVIRNDNHEELKLFSKQDMNKTFYVKVLEIEVENLLQVYSQLDRVNLNCTTQ